MLERGKKTNASSKTQESLQNTSVSKFKGRACIFQPHFKGLYFKYGLQNL